MIGSLPSSSNTLDPLVSFNYWTPSPPLGIPAHFSTPISTVGVLSYFLSIVFKLNPNLPGNLFFFGFNSFLCDYYIPHQEILSIFSFAHSRHLWAALTAPPIFLFFRPIPHVVRCPSMYIFVKKRDPICPFSPLPLPLFRF